MSAAPPPAPERDEPAAPSGRDDPFAPDASAGHLVLAALRGLAPSLLVDVAGTLIVYELALPHFARASVAPLLLASLFPLLGNVASVVRRRHLDPIGVVVLIGLVVSVVGVLLGGGQRLLLIRESFATGAIGFALLGSLALPKPLGYYFARQLMAAHDPAREARFDARWQHPAFRRSLRAGTIFWGLLLLGEFALRVLLVLTLPVVVVLAVAPLVFGALILAGVVVSAVWGGRLLRGDGNPR